MKGLLVSALIGAAIGGAVVGPSSIADYLGHAEDVAGLYSRVFPGDPLKREALNLCFQQDHGFNRLAAAERDACYDRFMPSQEAAAHPAVNSIGVQAANFVDLWQAAGRGHTTKDDIRAQQQAARVIHPAAAKIMP